MPTILILDDDKAANSLIHRVGTEEAYNVLTSQSVEEFCDKLASQPIDLAMISLAMLSAHEITHIQSVLQQAPSTEVLGLTPHQPGDGLTTLLNAEALRAGHLLAKPVDPLKLIAMFTLIFPLQTQQT